MNELALFAGAGGGILGGHLLGWRTVCAVEWADYPRKVLLARQRDGILPRFPIWDDVQTFDGNPWRGRVDVVSGGFPCQDISAAGKGAGIDGARSGMWHHMARIVREIRPRFVFVENSPMLTSRGLGRVLGDLAAMGYDAEWGVLGACDCGAPHKRDRIWIVAHAADVDRDSRRAESARQLGTARPADGGDDMGDSTGARFSERSGVQMGQPKEISEPERPVRKIPDTNAPRLEERNRSARASRARASIVVGDWWATEPALGRVANGVANRVDRLRAIGNGQVPAVAAAAFRLLTERAGWTA